MRRVLISACAGFAFATGGVASYIITQDRQDTLRAVGERSRSMSRMIIAHGDAAADAALQIIGGVYPLVEAWDMADEATARAITARLKATVEGNNMIPAAWVLDAQGHNIADSWNYPQRELSGADRPYFKAHLEGASDPVIAGDDRVGRVTGKERFTVSQAVRRSDGFNIDEQKGFGLRAVRTMLQPLGGRLTAENLGDGTSFTVIVPAAALRRA